MWGIAMCQTSLVAQTVKRLSTMWGTRVRSLGWEDPLEKKMAIHSSTIAWKIPWTEDPGRLQSMGSQRVGHDWATSHSFIHQFSSVVQLCPTLCNPNGLQHARLSCLPPTPRSCSNSCPSSWWCHPTISSTVTRFSSCPQSFPASESFPVSQFFASGGQRTEISPSALVLPINIQDWFPLGLSGWISLQSKRLSRVFSNTTVQKHQFFDTQLSL